jgi:hypothetical protein
MVHLVNGTRYYQGDTFTIRMTRYSDPERKNLARNAARYLGKKDTENLRRPLSIIRQGHVPEIYRGEYAEFEFIDVSKEVYDHLATYTTRKMRVAGGNRALTSDDFTMPSDRMKNPAHVEASIEASMNNYKRLLNSGETPQVARAAMPVNAKMNIFVYSFNFLTLGTAFFKQRIWEKGAQGNTVEVVKGMYELVHSVDPELWDTFYEWFGEPAAEWTEVRRKFKKSNMTVDELVEKLISSPHIHSPNESAEEALRKLFGEQKTMW